MEFGKIENVIKKLEELGYANASYSVGNFYFDNPISHVTLGYDQINTFHIVTEAGKWSPQGLTIIMHQAKRVSEHVEQLNKLL